MYNAFLKDANFREISSLLWSVFAEVPNGNFAQFKAVYSFQIQQNSIISISPADPRSMVKRSNMNSQTWKSSLTQIIPCLTYIN